MAYLFTTACHTVELHHDLCCPVYAGLTLSDQSFAKVEHYHARSWEALEEKAAEARLVELINSANACVIGRLPRLQTYVSEGEVLALDCKRRAARPIIGDERDSIQRALATLTSLHRAALDDEEPLMTATDALPRLVGQCRSPLMSKTATQAFDRFSATQDQRRALIGKLGALCEQVRQSLLRLDDPEVIEIARQVKRSIRLERVWPADVVRQEMAKVEARMRHDGETLERMRACLIAWEGGER